LSPARCRVMVLAIDPCLSIGQHFVICIRMYFALWQNLTESHFYSVVFLGDWFCILGWKISCCCKIWSGREMRFWLELYMMITYWWNLKKFYFFPRFWGE
jgi:hypothetical protein